jgi:acyl-phosphate glycerol 3-phosphate acyltransferase
MPPLSLALGTLLSYLTGAVPFGYLIARARGVDILHAGSGNIGATNVGRVLGKRFGLLVFALDFAKGAVPTFLCLRWLGVTGGVIAGLAAFIGHLFPIYLRFRGGKGVATGAGVVAVLFPLATAGAVAVWIAAVAAWRYVSLASVLAGLALVGLRLLTAAEPDPTDRYILTGFSILAVGLVVVRHRANLSRLYHGTENRIPEGPAMHALTRLIHVLALSLWFGSGVFFSFIAAPLLFSTFEHYGAMPTAERPTWLPVALDLDKEGGTRLAGVAVGPMFPWYYALQGACGLLAVATAAAWGRSPSRRVDRWRFYVLVVALVLVLAGWPLVPKIEALRLERYAGDEAAKAAFLQWHLVSLFLNLAVVSLVTVAIGMAAWLPAGPGERGA